MAKSRNKSVAAGIKNSSSITNLSTQIAPQGGIKRRMKNTISL
jgi:hypothetical protein